MKFHSHFLKVHGNELHIRTAGDRQYPHLLCVHALTRTGRDYDHVAHALAERYFLIMPDLPGRGLSSWPEDASEGYRLPVYADILNDVANYFESTHVHWLGTSLGGLIALCAGPNALDGRLKSLILNDVGPEVPQQIAEAIAHYTMNVPEFAHASDMLAHVKQLYAPFGIDHEDHWRIFLRRSLRRNDRGMFTFQHDTRILEGAIAHPEDMKPLWSHFEQMAVPILLFHGAQSPVLPEELLQRMIQVRPDMCVARIEECGHAPYLDTDEQLNILSDFLDQIAS